MLVTYTTFEHTKPKSEARAITICSNNSYPLTGIIAQLSTVGDEGTRLPIYYVGYTHWEIPKFNLCSLLYDMTLLVIIMHQNTFGGQAP